MQGNLWVALRLQVGYDRLATQLVASDHGQHLIKFAVHESQLEDVLCGVHLQQEMQMLGEGSEYDSDNLSRLHLFDSQILLETPEAVLILCTDASANSEAYTLQHSPLC